LCPVLKSVPRYLLFHDFSLKSFLALSSDPFSKLLKQIPLLSFNLNRSANRCGTARRAYILQLLLIPLPRLQPVDFSVIRPPSHLLLDVLEVQLGVGLEDLVLVLRDRLEFGGHGPVASPLSE
jgi:hypothetical protein